MTTKLEGEAEGLFYGFPKANPNVAFAKTLTAILRDQRYFVNNMVRELT